MYYYRVSIDLKLFWLPTEKERGLKSFWLPWPLSKEKERGEAREYCDIFQIVGKLSLHTLFCSQNHK